MRDADPKAGAKIEDSSEEYKALLLELEFTLEELESKIAPGLRLGNHNEILVMDAG